MLRSILLLMVQQVFSRALTFAANVMIARHLTTEAMGVASVNFVLFDSFVLHLCKEPLRRVSLRYAFSMTNNDVGDKLKKETNAPNQKQHENKIMSMSSDSLHQRRSVSIVKADQDSRANDNYHSMQDNAQVSSRFDEAIGVRVQQVLNMIWLHTLPLATIIISGILIITYYTSHVDTVATTYNDSMVSGYHQCMMTYSIAVFLEMLVEPLYVVATMSNRLVTRVAVESASMMARVATLFYLVVLGNAGLEAFGIAQIVSSCVLIVGYIIDVIRQRVGWRFETSSRKTIFFSPARPSSTLTGNKNLPYLDPSIVHDTRLFTRQSIQKFVLTEGEKIVMVALYHNPSSQGVYALVQNLGSLIARLVFQPIEEVSTMEFSRIAHAHTHYISPITAVTTSEARVTSSSSSSSSAQSLSLLSTLLKLVILLGLLVACFGPAYSFVVLDTLYGSRWSITSAPILLSMYSVYLLVMAINGVSESFVSSVMPGARLGAYNMVLLQISTIHIVCTAVFLYWGEMGIIVSNSFNMCIRIIYSARFMLRVFGYTNAQRLLRMSLPQFRVGVALTLCVIVTQCSRIYFGVGAYRQHNQSLRYKWQYSFAPHVCIGCVCILFISVIIVKFERNFIATISTLLWPGSHNTKQDNTNLALKDKVPSTKTD